jgi:hypothetical protein
MLNRLSLLGMTWHDPAIHHFHKKMDARVEPWVEPAHDGEEQRLNSKRGAPFRPQCPQP